MKKYKGENTMEKRRTFLLATILLSFSLLLAACSGGEETKDESDNSGSESKDGGTLIFGRGADSVGLDPVNITDGESVRVTNNIYERLFVYDENLKLDGNLATDYKVAEDGKTWTINLKEDVQFHDGTDFNAEAVVFNFNRWMDKDNPYHDGDFTYYAFLFGGFKGDPGHIVEYVKAIDETTVEIKLTKKVGPFISYLAVPMLGIASPTAIKEYGEEYYEHPVGTGPFKFVSWSRNDKIVLEKNENYHVDGQPKLDKLIFRVIPDNSSRLTALQTGEIDMMDGMNPDSVEIVKSTEGIEFVARPSFNMGYMAFNMEKEPFDNVKVRKAIDKAINKQAIVDAFFNGLADVAVNAIPPSLWGYNDEVGPVEYDVEVAKQLLADAGYPDGFDTTLYTMNNPRPYMPQPMKIAEAIQADLKEIGINAEIKTFEWATYLEKGSQGAHDMALFGWTGVMADPDNFLFPNLSATNAEKPANNRAFYKSEEFTSLLQEARSTFERKERAELYRQAQAIMFEDRPWAMLAHTTPPIALADYVEGFVPHPMSGDKFNKVSLSK